MADTRDFTYRPNIPAPDRKAEGWDPNEQIEIAREEAAILGGIAREDIPSDPLESMLLVFSNYELQAVQLRQRAEFMLGKAIQDLDGYVGGMPTELVDSLELLIQREVNPYDRNDSSWTLSDCEKECIFRTAGYFDPTSTESSLSSSITGNWDSAEFREKLQEKIGADSYMKSVNYGLRMLRMVVKLCMVVIIHSTLGYMCSFLRGKLTFKIVKKKVRLGDKLADPFGKAEKRLLGMLGFSCSAPGTPPVDCTNDAWEQIGPKVVPCCNSQPIFVNPGSTNGEYVELDMSRCVKNWIRQETDPSKSGGRALCNSTNCADKTLTPSAEEIAAARLVAEFLMNGRSQTGVTSSSDISVLSTAIGYANSGASMSQQVQSAINTNITYRYTGTPGAVWDCFGYEPVEGGANPSFRSSSGTVRPQDMPIVENGAYFADYMKMMDNVIKKALSLADTAISGVARLARWGASAEICCWVYLMVIIASLIHSLKTTGSLCPDKEWLEGDSEGSISGENGFRDQLRWASRLRADSGALEFLTFLFLLKQIIDMFIRKMQRAVFLAGLKLPLHDMWEQIKVMIANGMSEFLDIIFAPIDMVLSGLRGFPELRHMIDNECFGFGNWLDFLLCLLGDLKAGLINWVMQFLSFNMNDFVIINDMYISRQRLSFLESLSRLLQALINLILGLRDCYDPSTVTDQIVANQLRAQYDSLRQVAELFSSPEDQAMLDEISQPIFADTSFDAQPADPASLGAMFSHPVFADVDEFMQRELGSGYGISSLTGSDGSVVSFADFCSMMNERGAVRISEVRESMQFLYERMVRDLQGRGA